MNFLELLPLHFEFPVRTGLRSLRGLTFDDVSILPARTNVRPDKVSVQSIVLKDCAAPVPVFSAPMQTVWSIPLTCTLAEFGAIGPITRDLSLPDLEAAISAISSHLIDLAKYPQAAHRRGRPVIVVTASPFDTARLELLVSHPEVDYILLDTVHPYNDAVIEVVEKFSAIAPHRIAIGNIATAEAAVEFCRYPIAGIKVGLGPGSICTTREISGIGVPQLEAIEEVSRVAKEYGIPVIADGGIRTCGDIAKALAAGASSVMMGRLFAGTLEAAGDVIEKDGVKYKFYAGSQYHSVELDSNTGNPALDDFIKDIATDLRERNHRVEGVSGLTPLSGPAKALLLQISRSLGASLAFTGAKTLSEFRQKARFIQISQAAFYEGGAHSLPVVTHKNQFFDSQSEGK
ncbi:guanosine monophosphate reductase [bacterium]|nr:guanosine monophosphate reductase [bacterium]